MIIGKRTLLAKTCPVCEELKQAHEFRLMKNGYRNSWCNYCHTESGKPVMHQHQEATLSRALSHREPWTDEDIEQLKEMAADGLSGPAMALALGRSTYAVYSMKHKVKEQHNE